MNKNFAINFQNLFESLPERYIVFALDDPIFTIIAQTNGHAEMAMVKRRAVIGQGVHQAFPDRSPKYRQTGVSDIIESFRRVIKTGQPDSMSTFRFDLKNKNNVIVKRYFQVVHRPIFDDQNKLAALYQITNDVTAATLAGQQLDQVQRQLTAATAISQIGTWVYDIANNIVYTDKNMNLLFGIEAADPELGLPLQRFIAAIYDEDRARVERELRKAIETENLFDCEYRTQLKDGSVRWVLARGKIERDKRGVATSFPGVVLDITDRKHTENNRNLLAQVSTTLSSSLDYKKTLISIAKLAVPVIADWCSIEMLNAANELEQMVVVHKDPKKVVWARELRAKQGPPNLNAPTGFAKVLRTGAPEFYPQINEAMIRATSTDEAEIKLALQLEISAVIIVPLKIESAIVGAISLVLTGSQRSYNSDDLEMAEELARRSSLAMTNAHLYGQAQVEISERIKLENQLREANEALESRVQQRTQQLETLNTDLERSNHELQDFAYVASHDLQEPLRKIQAFGNLLEQEYVDQLGEGADYLRRMQNAAARMSSLIGDLLAFSRVTTQTQPVRPLSIKTVVDEVLIDLETRLADTKGRVTCKNLPTLEADPLQMRQLFQNLLSNALKFHKAGAPPIVTITSSLKTDSSTKIKYAEIIVQDNGVGFDEKYLDKIFALFQRLHNRQTYEGTGIGLAVCRKIVERHAGTITATSQAGQGASFIISLPLKRIVQEPA